MNTLRFLALAAAALALAAPAAANWTYSKTWSKYESFFGYSFAVNASVGAFPVAGQAFRAYADGRANVEVFNNNQELAHAFGSATAYSDLSTYSEFWVQFLGQTITNLNYRTKGLLNFSRSYSRSYTAPAVTVPVWGPFSVKLAGGASGSVGFAFTGNINGAGDKTVQVLAKPTAKFGAFGQATGSFGGPILEFGLRLNLNVIDSALDCNAVANIAKRYVTGGLVWANQLMSGNVEAWIDPIFFSEKRTTLWTWKGYKYNKTLVSYDSRTGARYYY